MQHAHICEHLEALKKENLRNIAVIGVVLLVQWKEIWLVVLCCEVCWMNNVHSVYKLIDT